MNRPNEIDIYPAAADLFVKYGPLVMTYATKYFGAASGIDVCGCRLPRLLLRYSFHRSPMRNS
jgi:hypothetical protein